MVCNRLEVIATRIWTHQPRRMPVRRRIARGIEGALFEVHWRSPADEGNATRLMPVMSARWLPFRCGHRAAVDA
jgi:hypothetical protein